MNTKEKLAAFFLPTSPTCREWTFGEQMSGWPLFGESHTIWKTSGPGRLVKFWSKSQSLEAVSEWDQPGPWGEQVAMKPWLWLRAQIPNLRLPGLILIHYFSPLGGPNHLRAADKQSIILLGLSTKSTQGSVIYFVIWGTEHENTVGTHLKIKRLGKLLYSFVKLAQHNSYSHTPNFVW